jgi:predicted O-linked N-acetylglucosamine transferase (SPINDLY family)
MNNINLLFQQAVQFLNNNQLQESEKTLQKIIKSNVKHVDVYFLMGNVLGMQQKYKDALNHFHAAIKLDPKRPDIYLNLGTTFEELKNHPEAIKAFKKSLSLDGKNAITLLALGKAYFSAEQNESALESFKQSLALNPQDARTWYNLGIVQDKFELYDAAIASYDKALELQANLPEALVNKGNTLFKKQALENSLKTYEQAIDLKKDLPDAYAGKAQVYKALNRLDDAYRSCIEGLEFNPQHIELLNKLGLIFVGFYKFEDGIKAYEEVLKIDPKNAQVRMQRGEALAAINRHEEALAEFHNVYKLNPQLDSFMETFVHTKMYLCDWGDLEKHLAVLKNVVALPDTGGNPFISLSTLDMEHQYLVAKKAAAQFHLDREVLRVSPIKSDRKIRIAYISADFRTHPVARLTAELFELHNRDAFEVFGFSVKGTSADDPFRQRLMSAFDEFIDLEGLPIEEAYLKVLSYNIDILMDLGGHTADSAMGMLNMRLAPIQMSYIGHPGTSGASFIDYTIGDRVLIPQESQQYYSEKILYMPHCFQVNDSKREVPQDLFTKEDFDLPADQFVFCSFNNNYKINPKMFDSWSRILKRAPHSVLWLLGGNPTTQHNLIKEAKARGIDPSRLIFASRIAYEKYLARFRVADLFLDTLPFNAGTTASDCLWAGLPVLTTLGDAFAGRMAGSLLMAMELPELVANTLEEYENKAVELAQDPARVKALKETIEKNRFTTPLFDSKSFTKDLELGYQKMMDRFYNHQEPDHIYLER